MISYIATAPHTAELTVEITVFVSVPYSACIVCSFVHSTALLISILSLIPAKRVHHPATQHIDTRNSHCRTPRQAPRTKSSPQSHAEVVPRRLPPARQ